MSDPALIEFLAQNGPASTFIGQNSLMLLMLDAAGGCILASRWDEVRVVLPGIAIWTGMLFVVSLFYLDQFDFTRNQVWVWFAAYILYPLIAIWLTWRHRGDPWNERLSGPNADRLKQVHPAAIAHGCLRQQAQALIEKLLLYVHERLIEGQTAEAVFAHVFAKQRELRPT